jgi:tripartite-type tricarboxylate transporter receptor subunit TctC
LGDSRLERRHFALRYDLLVDFEPVALVSSDPLLIVARKSMPANDLKEFIAWLKANPDQATQGTTGAGGISTVGGLFFRRATGTQFRFVPYRGGLGPAMQDLVAGQIDFMIDTAANSLPQVRAGTIKAYALTAKARLPAAPDIPTVDEAGLAGLHALNWQAVFVPKGTPKDAVMRLNSAVRPRWPMRQCDDGSPISGRKYSRASRTRRRRSRLIRRLRSRNGGRSSRKLTSRWNESVPRVCRSCN